MNTKFAITPKSSDAVLSDEIRQDAAKSIVRTPSFTILSNEALEQLLDAKFDEQLGMLALERSKEPQEGPTLEEVKREYGL
jgi:hypothetical protein